MKKKFIYLGIGVISVLLISLGIYNYFYKGTSSAKKSINQFVTLLNEKKYDEMYGLISEESKGKISKDDFIKRNKNIYEGIESNNIEVKINKIENKGKESSVNIDISMNTIAGELSFQNTVKLIKEKSQKDYGIEWNSSFIIPKLEDDNKIRVSKIKSKRGNILDRNDKPLAMEGKVLDVGVVPKKLGENKENNLNEIAKILGISREDIDKKLGASYVKEDMFVPLKVIAEDDRRKEFLLNIKGVLINSKDARVYPLGEAAAHLIGYVQFINAEELEKYKDDGYVKDSIIGKAGLEKIYEKKIRGVDGSEIYIVDKSGERKSTVLKKDVKNGDNIKLTIDISMQNVLYSQLKDDAGTAVAMNSKTGEVLALVSTPAYDSNDFIMGMESDKWKKLNEDAKKPLYNRFQSNSTPGSVFKPIIGAIGIDNKTINPEDNKNIKGLRWQKDSSWGGYFVTRVKDYGDNSNLLNAMIYSDNIYFAKAALDIGKDKLSEKLKGLGLGESLPFEYGVSKSQFAVKDNIKTEIQLADSGYGQGEILLNPIHLASIYTMFVNEGNVMNPYLEYKSSPEPKVWKDNAVSKEAADTILKDMIQVVENPSGTGHQAYIAGLNIAGKTGTAEIKLNQQDTKGRELGWFVAMTVNDKSNLLVVAMAEDVKDRGGSHYVVPKVRKVFENIK